MPTTPVSPIQQLKNFAGAAYEFGARNSKKVFAKVQKKTKDVIAKRKAAKLTKRAAVGMAKAQGDVLPAKPSRLKKHGKTLIGATDNTVPALLSGALPLAAGIGSVVYNYATHSFSPSATQMQTVTEVGLAFGLPAAAVGLVKGIVAKPTAGKIITNTVIAVGLFYGTVWGVNKAIDNDLLPFDSPFLNWVASANSTVPVDLTRTNAVLTPGVVKSLKYGDFFPTFAMNSKPVGSFEPGQEYCVTDVILGDANPSIQIEKDGKRVYAPNVKNVFIPVDHSDTCKDKVEPFPGAGSGKPSEPKSKRSKGAAQDIPKP